jgi:hypothetical protein
MTEIKRAYDGTEDRGEWVPFWPDKSWAEAGLPMPGQRVIARYSAPGYGIDAGTGGLMVAAGRSTRSHERFAEISRQAQADGRELAGDDYECLIDEEGPVVLFDGHDEPLWLPGQANFTDMEPVEEGSAEVIRRIPVDNPDTDKLAKALKVVSPAGVLVTVAVEGREYAIAEVRYEEDLAGVVVVQAGRELR